MEVSKRRLAYDNQNGDHNGDSFDPIHPRFSWRVRRPKILVKTESQCYGSCEAQQNLIKLSVFGSNKDKFRHLRTRTLSWSAAHMSCRRDLLARPGKTLAPYTRRRSSRLACRGKLRPVSVPTKLSGLSVLAAPSSSGDVTKMPGTGTEGVRVGFSRETPGPGAIHSDFSLSGCSS